ncbi:opacity protein-like surface antigen [Labrys monachus]|uniref:Opacity protein-like surface antigen n=2 Tax=Labrys monachus TaxID=217067 RepID=A0ABU0F9B7_9HYPH|nr:opacity protein-like surface antigen [Labrys monachus]
MLPPLPSLDQPGNVDDSGSGAGWYLRGGFGASLPGGPAVRPSFVPGAATRSEGLHAGWAVGGALGYQLGWLRGDLSLDYLGPRDFGEHFSGACGTACAGTLKGRFSAIPVLANLYYDIGTWNNLTPYVGAGAGIAHVDWDRIELGGSCDGACPAASGAGSWHFAWQVGAGLDYALTDRLSMEVDYRLLDLGNARAGSTPVGNLAARTVWDNEVRIGLRYKLN